MMLELWILLALIIGLGIGIWVGQMVWGKQTRAQESRIQSLQMELANTQSDLSSRREQLGRAQAEVESYRAQAEEARPYIGLAAELQANLAATETLIEERDRAYAASMAERDKLHSQHIEDLRNEFQRLASEALGRAQQQFTEQAAETLKLHRAEATRGLFENREALAKLVDPMRETLSRYGEELKQLETKREQAYGSLSEQLQSVALGQQAVKAEAGKIVAALRSSSKASGAWGEAQLRNVLDMAGLKEGIDYTLQTTTTDEEGKRRRPDAILNLPGGRQLIVDSKCSLGDYLAASEAESEADRVAALRRHAAAVRNHARGLAEKAYWKEFAQSADFVVMFLPGENFLSAAFEQDLDLLSWALDQRILLAGPTNLLAIARVVAMVWRQEKMAEEARTIGQLGADLYESLATMTGHVVKVGRNISEAAGAYNDFIGSLESRVLSKARRFPELGIDKGKKSLPELNPIERSVRHVQAADMKRIESNTHQPINDLTE